MTSQVSNISRRRSFARAEGNADYVSRRIELAGIAAQLFKERGYQSTRLADIAHRAGLDRSTIYYYVGSKEEFLHEIIDGVLDTNIAKSKRLMADTSLAHIERLRAIYIGMMESYEANYPAAFVYIQEQMHQVDAQTDIMQKTHAFDRMLIRFIGDLIRSGDLRSDISERVAGTALLGMLNWTHRWFTPGGGMTGREVAEAFWSIFVHGMQGSAGNCEVVSPSWTG